MASLYELAAEYRALDDTLADGDFDPATVADTIEASGLPDDLAQKAQNIEFMARNLDGENAALQAEVERMVARIGRNTKKADSLRGYILQCLKLIGRDKLPTTMFTFSTRKSEAVDVFEAEKLPAEFWHMPEPKPPVAAPDKAAIKAAIKEGKEVPGARMQKNEKLVVK